MKSVKWTVDFVLVALLIFLSVMNSLPKSVSMPDDVMMVTYVVTLVLVASFLAFLWHDRPADERELVLQTQASRFAYLIGAAVLIVALLIEGFRHHVDPALPIALLAMVGVKVLAMAINKAR